MKAFFDNLGKGKKNDGGGNRLGGSGGGGSNNNNNNNPFQNWNLPGQQRKFKGEGQSLGGSQPGKVVQFVFAESGPLGMKVEKRKNNVGSAIVASVVAGGQAEQLGLKRGDILCFSGSNGEHEIMYEQFLDMVKSNQRPLYFEVRRIQSKAANANPNADSHNTSKKSADAYAKKAAVIAAAEAREKAAKAKMKPIPKISKDKLPTIMSNAEKYQLEVERQQRLNEQQEPKSEEAKRAMEVAKANEARLAAQLGYNPYETSKVGAGQARSATVTEKHGSIQGTTDGSVGAPSSTIGGEGGTIPVVAPPTDPSQPLPSSSNYNSNNDTSTNSNSRNKNEVHPDFDEVYTVIISSSDSNVASIVSSISIMRKLIVNATTKGQDENNNGADKFRRVRLSNAKIKAAIVDVHGAFDLMMLVGFQLIEEGSESYLIFPLGSTGPNWLPQALQRMENYEKANK